MRGHRKALAGGLAACLALVAVARADDAPRPEAVTSLDALTIEIAPPSFDFGGGSTEDALPWHERFTFTGVSPDTRFTFGAPPTSAAPRLSLTGSDADLLEFAAGDRWSFTLGLSDLDDFSDFGSLSAGAFFDLSPRMRVGGAVSFTNPETGLIPGEPSSDDVPQIKLESAFRF